MNECKEYIIKINYSNTFFFIVNSLAYCLLWPSETDRQVISGIDLF